MRLAIPVRAVARLRVEERRATLPGQFVALRHKLAADGVPLPPMGVPGRATPPSSRVVSLERS